MSKFKDKSQEYLELKSNKSNKYYYQIELSEIIEKRLLTSDNISGLLVLPTGGGKTRVAVTTALDKAIKYGYKIFWIAHRHMLLEQAEKTFYEFSALANKKLSIKVISGIHNSIQSISKEDDIVIINNMSMGIREKDENDENYDGLIRQTLKQILFTKEQNWLIIVDEAHHSIAPVYREWIDPKKGWLRQHRKENIKILGLTATPNFISKKNSSKYDENRTKELSSIYDNNLIATISTQKLIDDEILSNPIFTVIDTDIELDADEILNKVQELKGSLKDVNLEEKLNEQIAKHEGRNKLIVSTYLNGYNHINFKDSPTLIFAVNIVNAITLNKAFNNVGIASDVIYSGNKNNESIIDDFRKGKLKILINVEILTEGSDIPEIQNVFIARITGSKILYRQMVGRALRGIDSGGTKIANIITFKDNILNYHEDFFDVQNLKYGLFSEIPTNISNSKTISTIQQQDIEDAYDKFTSLEINNKNIELISAIPIGYYYFYEMDRKLNVYQHQLDSYRNFILSYNNDNSIINNAIQIIKEQYFKSENMIFDVLLSDLDLLIKYLKKFNNTPKFIEFQFKEKLDNELRNIVLNHLNILDFKKLKQDYNKSIYAINFFKTYNDFEEECLKLNKQFRHHRTKSQKIIEIEKDIYPTLTFDETIHDKNIIFENAKKKILKVLNKKELEYSPNKFEWTTKAYKSYYGMAYSSTDDYVNSNHSRIKINKILQLKEIPNIVIEFVVYHELLHTELQNYTHDKEFKRYESMFPDFVYCEQMLYKITNSNIDNLSKTKLQNKYKIYDKDKISNLKKLIKNQNLTLLDDKELQDIYKNKSLKDTFIADGKNYFLANDLTKSMCISDGKFYKKVQNAHLIVKEYSYE